VKAIVSRTPAERPDDTAVFVAARWYDWTLGQRFNAILTEQHCSGSANLVANSCARSSSRIQHRVAAQCLTSLGGCCHVGVHRERNVYTRSTLAFERSGLQVGPFCGEQSPRNLTAVTFSVDPSETSKTIRTTDDIRFPPSQFQWRCTQEEVFTFVMFDPTFSFLHGFDSNIPCGVCDPFHVARF
jgi:hypothetical protein